MTDERDSHLPAPVVGMVGAGQLARMTCQAAISLAVEFRVLAATGADSAAQICAGTVTGDYSRLDDLCTFAAGCDVVTFDHEHVPAGHLAALEQAGVAVRPGAAALRYTQDKLAMRDRLDALGVPCPRYAPVADLAGVAGCAAQWGWPIVLKAVSGGYDGRGVWVCRAPSEAAAVLAHQVPVFAEEHVGFDAELAALVARSPHGQAAAYPVVQTVQRDGICHEVLAPAPGLPPGQALDAQRIALELAAELGVTGLLAVELFLAEGGLLVNELAMRPHNSGHWTIEGARTSQFEQHLRAVLDLPLGDPRAAAPCMAMANVFGATGQGPSDGATGPFGPSGGSGPLVSWGISRDSAVLPRASGQRASDEVTGPFWPSGGSGGSLPRASTSQGHIYARYRHVMAADPGAKVHLYGKPARPGRKIGHVTVLGEDSSDVRARAVRAAGYLATGKE